MAHFEELDNKYKQAFYSMYGNDWMMEWYKMYDVTIQENSLRYVKGGREWILVVNVINDKIGEWELLEDKVGGILRNGRFIFQD